MKTRWKMLMLAVFAMTVAVGSIGAVQPREAQEAQTSAQLLQEVRALRAAIERMTVAGTRAQLLLGRLQMQEQRMTSLGQQLQATRAKLASVQQERQREASRVDTFTEGLEHSLPPDQRQDMEQGLKMTKQRVAQLDQQVNALQLEDAGVGQALSAEQARWVELNARLEELEGLLATQKP
jgi:chromosome segregation ATPase